MNSLLPLDTLAETIKARIDAGDKAIDKAGDHYLAAGLLLIEAKERVARTPGLTWSAFVFSMCRLQRSRADELIAIANGKITLEQVRAGNRARAARHRRNNPPLRNGKSSEISPQYQSSSEYEDPKRKAWRQQVDALLDQTDLPQLKEAARYIRGLIDGGREAA
jgi:hypothetical protein